jgi:hypothetical protein
MVLLYEKGRCLPRLALQRLTLMKKSAMLLKKSSHRLIGFENGVVTLRHRRI